MRDDDATATGSAAEAIDTHPEGPFAALPRNDALLPLATKVRRSNLAQ